MAKLKMNFKKIGMKAAGGATGGVAGKMVNKFLPNLNPKLRAGLKIIAGAAIPEFMPKNAFVGDMGVGMIAIGAAELVEELAPALVSGVAGKDDGLGAIDDETFTIDTDYVVEGIGDQTPGGGKDEGLGSVDYEDNVNEY